MNNELSPSGWQHVVFIKNEQLAGIAMETLNNYWPNIVFEAVEYGDGRYEMRARTAACSVLGKGHLKEIVAQIAVMGYTMQVVNQYYTLK